MITVGRFKAQDNPYSINRAIDQANRAAAYYCGERQDIVVPSEGAIMSRSSYHNTTLDRVVWGRWEEY